MKSNPTLRGVLRQVRLPNGDDSPDGELIARYVQAGDEAAFAAVVHRYGGLVLGVARRQLADSHRADDVFQATFLALARAARTLGTATPLANWLYTVALRQARKLRGRDFRRESVERVPRRTDVAPDPLDEISGRELLRTIDEELARLPERLRLPVLLCCVQGLTREDASLRLGWTDGMVKGRLERGRRRLAERLAARGLAPSAMVLAPLGAVVVPGELLAAAAALAATPWSPAVPPAIASLATAVPVRKFLLTGGITVAVMAMGIAGWAVATGGPRPVEPQARPAVLLLPAPQTIVANPASHDQDPLPTGSSQRFGTTRFRHGTSIEHFVVSGDGTIGVATSGQRMHGMLRGYDLGTGKPLFTLDKSASFVDGIGLTPDGKTLATKRNHTVFLYDLASGRETGKIEYPSENPSSNSAWIEFTADGKRMAIGAATGTGIHLLDVETQKVLRTFEHSKVGNVVFGAAFSPDGKILAGAGYDREGNVHFARLWDVESGKELRRCLTGDSGNRTVTFTKDGRRLAIGADSGRTMGIRLFDVNTGHETLTIPFPDGYSIRSLAFSPDGKTLAAGGYSATKLFDAVTGKEKLRIPRRALGLRFSPDGASLVGAVGGAIYRWDAGTGKVLTPVGGDSVVKQIEVTADSKRLITLGQEGDAHIWDAKSGAHLRRIQAAWQRGVGLSPDGRYLVWSVEDESVKYKLPKEPNTIYHGNRLKLYDLAEDRFVERFGGYEGEAHDLFFADAGKTLFAVDHRQAIVRVWDVATGQQQRKFRAARDDDAEERAGIWSARLSPDGKVLAASYHPFGRGRRFFSQHAVRLWDTTTGKELFDLVGHWGYVEGLAFSPDGRYLVSASEPLQEFAQDQLKIPADQVFVWDVLTGQAVARLPAGGTAAAFAPDGKTLVTAAPDGTIPLWDTTTWMKRGELRGHRDRVSALTFAPDGRLLSGGMDTTVLAWNVKGK